MNNREGVDISQQTLPSQVTEELTIQTKETLETWKQNVREELKAEMMKHIHQLETEMRRQDVAEEHNVKDQILLWLVRAVFWLSCFIFTCVAGYEVSKLIVMYQSEPLMSTTRIIQNKTFQWPTISIQTSSVCYNRSALARLAKEHNMRWQGEIPGHINEPFVITDPNINWSTNNISEMYLQTKYRREILKQSIGCVYVSSETGEQMSCDKKGKWDVYNTQYTVQESFAFTPDSTSSINDKILFNLHTNLCYGFNIGTVAMHPPTDKYYKSHPSAQRISVKTEKLITVRVALEEFHLVNTKSSPCEEDTNYSQTQCFEAKTIEYKLQKAGCNFPGITSFQDIGKYPECKNASALKRFMKWHYEVYKREMQYDDLQAKKDECLQPCHLKKYSIAEKITEDRGRLYRKFAGLILELDSRAMSIPSITEKRAMPVDILIGNVGGTLGLFLGMSFLTLISGLQYTIKGFAKIYTKTVEIYQKSKASKEQEDE